MTCVLTRDSSCGVPGSGLFAASHRNKGGRILLLVSGRAHQCACGSSSKAARTHACSCTAGRVLRLAGAGLSGGHAAIPRGPSLSRPPVIGQPAEIPTAANRQPARANAWLPMFSKGCGQEAVAGQVLVPVAGISTKRTFEEGR
jgi:hypothetical protein